jgi:D-3-phosphoglycerate dehydrogenase
MSNLIFVALSTFAVDSRQPLDALKNSGYPYQIFGSGKRITQAELVTHAKNASVILAGVEPYDAETLVELPNLRMISRCGVGVDSIDLKVASRQNIVVANTPGIPTDAVAELALAMFLDLSRNLHMQANLMRKRRWERLTAHLLSGRTVGLIGLGTIGKRVAELCQSFNAKVIAYDPMCENGTALQSGVSLVSKAQLLREADIVSLHASKTPGKSVLIGADEFNLMKRGAVLVNLARGEMVDELALISALKSGQISGAGLDVFGTEPYAGPLCDFDQVILTPHSATNTIETRSIMELQCVENALNFLDGNLNSNCRII